MRPETRAAHADDFAQFAEAIAAFEPLRAKAPATPHAAAAYWRKCQALRAEPPAAWDGVWVMTEKQLRSGHTGNIMPAQCYQHGIIQPDGKISNAQLRCPRDIKQ